MPILDNVKHERFAQGLAAGKTQIEAYEQAGYKPNDSHAARLVGNGKVQARVAELQAIGAEKAGVTIEWIVAELKTIAASNMADYMKATTAGDPYLDFSKLTREQTAALAEVTVEDFTEGRGEDARKVRKVKFKLHDKRAALIDLGKHLGMFKDRQPGDSPDNPLHAETRIANPGDVGEIVTRFQSASMGKPGNGAVRH